MNALIGSELDRIELTQGVCIVYACESGSRAWGFESSDSDYDVRFIYLRPTGQDSSLVVLRLMPNR